MCRQLIVPPSTPDFLGEVGLNLVLGLLAVIRLLVGDLHAVGWVHKDWHEGGSEDL